MDNDTITTILCKRAQESPELAIYSFIDKNGDTETLTYEQLFSQSLTLASSLKAQTKEEDIILITLKPSLNFLKVMFGCILANRCFLPTYPMISRHDIARIESIMQKIPISLLICDIKPEKEGSTVKWSCPIKTLDELEEAPFIESPAGIEFHDPHKTIFLQLSSGTTHYPKALAIDHHSLISCLKNMQQALKLSCDDIGCSWLPPYHDMGLIGAIFLPLYVNFPVHMMSPSTFILDPLNWLRIINEKKVTVTAAPNLAYDLCSFKYQKNPTIQLDLSELRVAVNSSEMIRPQTLHRFHDAFKKFGFKWETFVPAYGLAEATLMVSCNTVDTGPCICSFSRSNLHKGIAQSCADNIADTIDLVSSGQVINGMHYKILEPNSLTPRNPYEIGEVWVGGTSLAKKYSNGTQETIESCVRKEIDNTGRIYVPTGDTGFIDEKGQLFITGRVKDIIKTPVYEVTAEEIEALLENNFLNDPTYRSAAVITEEQHQSQVIIVKEIGSYIPTLKDSLDIYNLLKAHFPVSIDRILYTPRGNLPRTTSGKIKRHALSILLKYELLEVVSSHSFDDRITH